MDENIGSDLQQEWLEIHDRHENVILRILEENRVLHDKVEQLESEKFTLQKAFSKLRQEVEDSESAKRDLQSKLASLTHREEASIHPKPLFTLTFSRKLSLLYSMEMVTSSTEHSYAKENLEDEKPRFESSWDIKHH
ncbi:SubName: Full=Uncharacterized protein {ECO:0000313/EMBL:CCA68127.1} [Serendipita indica DSM 11827]|nr:SubName: Full=Uncharacterized protein {ECO:0000313/EMBL:CCA68127.1} [Serendipita indica DSM 11827]